MQALGFIEVMGKIAAVEAADICVKSANVKLIGCELTNGALVTVKVTGDIGAVKSAVDAAKASVVVQGKLVATLVIPRPANGISSMVESKYIKEVVCKDDMESKKGSEKDKPSEKAENDERVIEVVEANNEETKDNPNSEGGTNNTKEVIQDINNSIKAVESAKEISTVIDINSIKSDKVRVEASKNGEINNSEGELVEENHQLTDKKDISCNLCHDPKCLRKRGQPKNLCIYYEEKSQTQ